MKFCSTNLYNMGNAREKTLLPYPLGFLKVGRQRPRCADINQTDYIH